MQENIHKEISNQLEENRDLYKRNIFGKWLEKSYRFCLDSCIKKDFILESVKESETRCSVNCIRKAKASRDMY